MPQALVTLFDAAIPLILFLVPETLEELADDDS